MHKRLAIAALGALSIPGLGFAGYPAVHALSASPRPQVVIPATFRSSISGTDDPANHDANGVAGADDPVNHEAADHDSDDVAVLGTTPPTINVASTSPATTPTTVSNSDERPGHDAGDDNDVDTVTSNPTPVTSVTSGRDSSGSGSGDSRGSSGRHAGSDDGPGHH